MTEFHMATKKSRRADCKTCRNAFQRNFYHNGVSV